MLPPTKLVLTLAIALNAVGTAMAQTQVDYLRDIKPILKTRCYACHGALKQESGLRLDTGSFIRKGGDEGAAIVSGQAGTSLLIEKVLVKDDSQRMPPEGEPLTAAQIETLRTWIAQGATSPDNEQPDPDPTQHWAFRRPRRPDVPVVGQKHRMQNPIDAFVEAELARHGLSPQPAAPKHVQLRRLFLDLIGLPPTPKELHEFLADNSSTAYEGIVDRLLNDKRHGERWARHWMDIWRYSDWYGRRHVPDVWNSAPQIWRWRDWIVGSLNADHGYDRMLHEMLAADEICPEDDAAAVATGYLIRNWYALNPNDWMRNTVEHTGKAFLGLTFNCAHCHDHKYDPITQEDYFRLRAFFEPIDVRQDRVPGEADPGPFQEYKYSTLRKIQRLGLVRIYDKTPDAPTWFYTGGDERNRVQERGSIPPGVPTFLTESPPNITTVELPTRAWYPGLRPAIHDALLAEARGAIDQAKSESAAARKTRREITRAERDQLVRAEAAYKTAVAAADGRHNAARAELSSLEARIAADRAKHGETPGADMSALAHSANRLERDAAVQTAAADVLAHEHALAIAESKPIDDAHRMKEIAAANKRLATSRPALDKARETAVKVATDVYSPFSPSYPKTSTGRRKALAEWITGRDNPLTARVAVNHIWSRHFHSPLVDTVTDFGRSGASPTHPELLDWLSIELMENGWSMKHMHRLIVTSAAYRRLSSARKAQAESGRVAEGEQDARNRLLSRMNVGRMEAEVVRDSLLYAAGKLDAKMGGQELENSEALTTFRRSLYYSVYPEQGGKSSLGELFDAPDALECYRRTRSIVPQQALALTNSGFVHQMSSILAALEHGNLNTGVRAKGSEEGTETNNKQFVMACFARILSRSPSDAELKLCCEAIDRQHALLAKTNPADAAARARESVVRALFNHNDFITIR